MQRQSSTINFLVINLISQMAAESLQPKHREYTRTRPSRVQKNRVGKHYRLNQLHCDPSLDSMRTSRWLLWKLWKAVATIACVATAVRRSCSEVVTDAGIVSYSNCSHMSPTIETLLLLSERFRKSIDWILARRGNGSDPASAIRNEPT